MSTIDEMEWTAQGATFSPCTMYRYRLWRAWDESKPRVVWVMLNPSTADAEFLDATIRRCVGYARRWGAGSIDVVNLFAFRATNPKVMKGCHEPIGKDNNRAIVEACVGSDLIMCAWGAHGCFMNRDLFVRDTLLSSFRLYSLANDATPHPLYQRGDAGVWPIRPRQTGFSVRRVGDNGRLMWEDLTR